MFADHPDRVKFMPRCYRLAGEAVERGAATALREELRPDAQWYRSVMFNEYHRPACIDGAAISFAVNRRTNHLVSLATLQDRSDPAPSPRIKSLLTLLNQQLAPLIGVALASNAQRGMRGLSTRLRQTLDALLCGESEKEIASRLGLSRATVHQYVGTLYQHFGVQSRAELMAYFLRRRPQSSP
jgi:DNA-binding CsgD family transcriptional regulator